MFCKYHTGWLCVSPSYSWGLVDTEIDIISKQEVCLNTCLWGSALLRPKSCPLVQMMADKETRADPYTKNLPVQGTSSVLNSTKMSLG